MHLCITPLVKGLCDTPLVLLTLKFHDLHPFLIYTPTPSVYAHPIFNCVGSIFGYKTEVVMRIAIAELLAFAYNLEYLLPLTKLKYI